MSQTVPTLLQITASLKGDASHSTHLTQEFVAQWASRHPGAQVIHRDLVSQPLPHLDGVRFGAFITPAEQRTPEQQAIVAESDTLIAEIRSADVIVIGVPLYNFGMPSQLKAYFDHIARAGVTFRYTANGPEGLIGGRKVYIMAARGGLYAGTDRDAQTAYLKTFLGFLGLTDLEFVYAEGLAMGENQAEAALAQASADIQRLAA